MFTGIIEEIGTVKKVSHKSEALEMVIAAKLVLQDIKLGDSIAINGVCLTVTSFNQDDFSVDVMPETFRATVLSTIKIGEKVNLERALAIGGRLGGHFVTGHVDGIGEIMSIESCSNAINYMISCNSDLLKYCILKGSITVDGTSLTIFGLDNNSFKLALIPHTVKNSVLGYKKIGDKVNIECDMLGKYVVNLLKQDTSTAKINQNFLQQHGFIDDGKNF